MTRNECLEILDLTPGASEKQIAAAYRRLAQAWHPDGFPNNPVLQRKADAELTQIHGAFQALRNQKSKPESVGCKHTRSKPRRSAPFRAALSIIASGTAIALLAALFFMTLVVDTIAAPRLLAAADTPKEAPSKDQPAEASTPKTAPATFKVPPTLLKKKFAGKASFNAKTGELTLKYDFASKKQMSDFAVINHKYQVKENVLFLEGAEELNHKARFKEFTASTTIQIKAMRRVGLATTKDVKFDTGGLNLDGIYLHIPEGTVPMIEKIVPVNLRKGTITMSLSVNATKTTGRWDDEVLAAPTMRKSDIHQVKLLAGDEGCYFTDLVIVGIPDPTWFEDLLKSE